MTRTPARRTAPRAVAAALLVVAAWVIVAPEVVVTLGRSTRSVAPDAAPDPADGRAGTDADAGDRPGAAGTDGSAAPTTAAVPGDGPGSGLHVVEVRGAWRDGEDLGTAVALAVLAGTAHVAADSPRGAVPAVAVEAVERPGSGAVVVTLLLAPPPSGGTDAVPTAATRLAVPLRLGADGFRLAGTPWRLEGVPMTPEAPPGRPISDPELIAAARTALDGAGFDGAALRRLDATDGWAFTTRLATDGATAGPAEDTTDPAAGVAGPWLRWHVDRFVVAGLPLSRAAGWERGTESP